MKKILVIEDENNLRENIVDLLLIKNYEVYDAENGKVGVEKASALIPDLIISDISMPVLDGFGALEELKKKKETSNIPFIFLSAKSEKIDIRRGMELGADDFLPKPFMPDDLFKAIEVRLKKQEQLKKNSEAKLEELRNNISTNLPHEFRTPLNGIMGTAQLLLSYGDTLDQEDLHTLYENIHTSSQRLYKLIVNYLLYADLETIISDDSQINQLRKDYSENLDLIIKDAVTVISSNERYKNDFVLDIQDCAIKITYAHLQKIIEELLDNACKFSTENNPVHIISKVENGIVQILIKNKGIKIEAEQIDRIGAYIQFDRKKNEQQGIGLGLSIVKLITKIYEGDFSIFVDNDEFTNVSIKFKCR